MLRKFFWLLFIVLLTFGIGQLILATLMLVSGANITSGSIEAMIESMDSTLPFKIGVGLSNLLMFAVSALVFCWVIAKAKAIDYFKLDKGFQLSWAVICLCFLLVSYPMIAYSISFLSDLDVPSWASSMDEQSIETLMAVLQMDSFGDLLINLIIIALIPAIGEELLFRGVIQKELIKSMQNPHVAIFVTAFIFSAIHLQIEGFPPKFILGIILGYTYYYTQNMIYPMLLHFFNNGSQLIALYLSGESVTDLDTMQSPDIHWSLAILSFALTAMVCRYIQSKSQENDISA